MYTLYGIGLGLGLGLGYITQNVLFDEYSSWYIIQNVNNLATIYTLPKQYLVNFRKSLFAGILCFEVSPLLLLAN